MDYLKFGPGHLITVYIRSDLGEPKIKELLKAMERRQAFVFSGLSIFFSFWAYMYWWMVISVTLELRNVLWLAKLIDRRQLGLAIF